jgi:hypothetical protein
MKTTYSRRELYALGEPIGESSTYELAGRRVYGGGGGIVGDLVGGVGDIVGGAADAVGGLGEGVIDTVKDVGSNIDDAVNELPGGWKLPLAAAAAYYGMPSGMGESSGLSGWDAAMADVAGSGGMGEILPQLGGWDAAMADLAGSGGLGEVLPGIELGGWDAAMSDLAGSSGLGSLAGGSGIGSKIAKMLGSSMTGSSDGLTLGGGLLGAAGIAGLMNMLKEDNKRYGTPGRQDMPSPLSQFNYSPSTFRAPTVDPAAFRPVGAPTAKVGYAYGGPVESMSNANAIGMNTGYPQADITGHAYATPWQTPVSQNVVQGTADTGVNRMTGQMLAEGGGISGLMNYARGGNVSNLGSYSDGGRMLKGPGDGMSDSIPASISGKQPARLADGEFVVPADVVSHLGNGSTDAGAKQLYKMMDKVRAARTGRKAQGKQINPKKYMPA